MEPYSRFCAALVPSLNAIRLGPYPSECMSVCVITMLSTMRRAHCAAHPWSFLVYSIAAERVLQCPLRDSLYSDVLPGRLLLVGTGVIKDENTVKAVSREGNRCTHLLEGVGEPVGVHSSLHNQALAQFQVVRGMSRQTDRQTDSLLSCTLYVICDP
jgi:hypothetical protein